MSNYRTAFLAALSLNLALVVLAAGLWWRTRTAVEHPVPRPATAMVAAEDPPSVSPAPAHQALAPVQISPERLQRIGVKIGEVRRQTLADRIRTVGNVEMDERRLAYVELRFPGYLQKVFVDSTYQYIRKGQPLFTVYSPDLLSTEREYLIARESALRLARSPDPTVAHDGAALVQAAAQRLALWRVPQREIERLKRTGRVREALTIDSPVSGYVTEREALPNAYVEPGKRLYTVADLSRIWVFAHVFQSDLGRVRVGDPATLTVDTYPGKQFHGTVDFIYPQIDPDTRTSRVRLEFANHALQLLPGMYVNVSLTGPAITALAIPANAVLQTGTQDIVFIDQGGGVLVPRNIRLGAEIDGQYVVLGGLRAGERIVTSANFLIDSESELQAALGSFAPPPPPSGAMRGPQPKITLVTRPTPARQGSNFLRVTLTDPQGKPMDGARVSVDFLIPPMPAMGMAGQRVHSVLKASASGVYEGTVMLPASGAWQVTVVARRDGRVIASRQLSLEAAEGM